MYKPGASYRDKNRIKLLHAKGKDQGFISQVTHIKPEHVKAIIKQIDAGTLRLSGTQTTKANSKDISKPKPKPKQAEPES